MPSYDTFLNLFVTNNDFTINSNACHWACFWIMLKNIDDCNILNSAMESIMHS